MQRSKQMSQEQNDPDARFDPRRVLVVFALLFFTFFWIVQSILTRDFWLKNLSRPYLPDWALLAIALTAPISLALAGLRPVPWKASVFFAFICLLQGSLFGLVGERYRWVQGGVTLFAYLEAYLLLPKLNRYIEDRNMPKDGTVLADWMTLSAPQSE
jgi:hypothetical protein